MDLTQLSDADLKALRSGNLSGVSDEGLKLMSGAKPAAPPAQEMQFDPMGMPTGPGTPATFEPAKTKEIAKGVAKGAVAGVPGAAADIYELGRMGPTGLQRGYKRQMPTTERIGEAMFGKPVSPEEKVGRAAGEPLGGFATAPATSAAATLGRGLSKPLSALGQVVTAGPKAAGEAERLRRAIPGVGQEALGEIMARGKRRELGLREAGQKFGSEAQAEREAAARRFSDLGTPQTDKAALGDEMQRRLVGTEFTRGARRSQRAAEDAQQYFSQAREKGAFVDSNEGKGFLNFLKNQMFSDRVTPAERKLAQDMYKDLGEAKDIEAVEKTFRKYNEASKGAPKEGYDAVMQQYAGSISDELSNALNKFSPKRQEFRSTYKDLSGPLDAYETSFGAKGVAREKAVPERVQMMPTEYPNRYFKNRDTIRALKEELAGDEAAVRKFANQHAVNELAGKDAKAAQSWLDTNAPWIDEVPGLSDRVKRYVYELAKSERTVAGKEKAAEAVGAKAKDIVSTRQAAESKLQQDINQLATLAPEQVSAKARQIVSDLQARRLVHPSKVSEIQKQINAVDQAYQGAEKAKRIRDVLVKYGLLSATGYGGYQLYKAL